MTRWLLGTFDPHGRGGAGRLPGALAGASSLVSLGPLHVAHSGPQIASSRPLCLLDGHLDNGAELAGALELAPTCSSEALIAQAWRRWGPDLLARLRGEFALLIWDPERRRGLLARDQLGVRSMFLHERSGTVSFASEVRDLLALLPSRPAPDRASVAHWLAMSSRPGSATLFAGVRRLDPGTALTLDERGARPTAYWEPRFGEPLDVCEPELAFEVRAALDLAVARRVADEGATGVLMSGGLDSSSVAATAAALGTKRLLACSGTFPEHATVDESALIEALLSRLDVRAITAEVRSGGLLASAVESTETWGLPLRSWGDFWALPLLRAAASMGVQVTLGGDGGDELFGARSFLLADRVRAGHPLQALELAHRLPGAAHGPPRREIAAMVGQAGVAGALPYPLHEHVRRLLDRAGTPNWMRAQTRRDLLDSEDPLAWKRLDGPRWWAHAAHGLTRGVEERGVFEHQRRRAASAGLEARHPLFDLDLLELCLQLAPTATFDPRRSRPVLRSAMAGRLPDEVRLRPHKAQFDALLFDCMAGADGDAARRLLGGPAAELAAYVDLGELRRSLIDDTRLRDAQPFRWTWQVWRLCTAEIWLRMQADPDGDPLGDLHPSPADVRLTPAVAEREPKAASYVFPP